MNELMDNGSGDGSLEGNRRVPVRGAAVLHVSPRTGRRTRIFTMARTSPHAHELISKDASCEICFSLFLPLSCAPLSRLVVLREPAGLKLDRKLTLKELSFPRSTKFNKLNDAFNVF